VAESEKGKEDALADPRHSPVMGSAAKDETQTAATAITIPIAKHLLNNWFPSVPLFISIPCRCLYHPHLSWGTPLVRGMKVVCR